MLDRVQSGIPPCGVFFERVLKEPEAKLSPMPSRFEAVVVFRPPGLAKQPPSQSASKFDPLERRAQAVALASSELIGVTEGLRDATIPHGVPVRGH